MEWYTVNTKPRQEHQAVLNLQTLGVQTFYPQIQVRKRVRRVMKRVTGPLFPGYIFARFDLETYFRTVTYARGVRKVVSFGPKPSPVDEEVIAGINARLTNGCLTVPLVSLTPGQCVRIQGGPLEGLEAIFEREMSDHQRVVLLLRALASQWRVVVPVQQVANL